MKKYILLSFIGLFLNGIAFSQDCNHYLPLKKGSEFEMLSFSAKDKPTGKIKYKIIDVKELSGKTEASIHSETYNTKDKKESETNYTIICEKGKVLIDMRSIIHPETMDAYKDMDVKISGDFIEMPSNLSPGQTLKDGTLNMLISDKKSGSQMSAFEMLIKNRKVVAKESMTVPAGTFDCFKISYDVSMVTNTMGIKIPINMKAIEWISAGKGIIKSETYSKNDKLKGYSVMVKVP